MMTTEEWASSHGISAEETVPPVDGYSEPYKRSGEEVAIRTIVLQCVVAVAYEVDPFRIVDWLKSQGLWDQVSPKEQAFLTTGTATEEERRIAQWQSEAEWALLWAIRKVESLGLPTCTCDTANLVDHIMPALGSSVRPFVSSAELRSPAEILAEDDRTYNLHCYARQAHRTGTALPEDLIYGVLYQRHYAFEWLSGDDPWDDVCTDT